VSAGIDVIEEVLDVRIERFNLTSVHRENLEG